MILQDRVCSAFPSKSEVAWLCRLTLKPLDYPPCGTGKSPHRLHLVGGTLQCATLALACAFLEESAPRRSFTEMQHVHGQPCRFDTVLT